MSMLPRDAFRRSRFAAVALGLTVGLAGCGETEPPAPNHYARSDALFDTMAANLGADDRLEKVVEIDHSRLGAAE
jgi:hypothetical protein